MPVSELHSSDFMGVPIKKRKYFYTCPSSPPPAAPDPLLQPEKESTVKSDLFSSTSATTSHPQYENKQTLLDSNQSAKTQMQLEPSKANDFGSNDTEMHLGPIKSGIQIHPLNIDNPKLSENSVNGLPLPVSLGPSFPDLPVIDGQRIRQDVKLDPCLWNLGLSKIPPSNHKTEVKISCTPLETNRNHWDLNTAMDTWESSMNRSAILHEVATNDKLNSSSKKTLLSQSQGSIASSKKTTLEHRGSNSKLSTLTAPVESQTKNDILLHLSLSTSALQTTLIPPPPCTSSSKLDANCDPSSNQNLSRSMLSLSREMNSPSSGIVKSEPSDESNIQDLLQVQACPLKLVNDTTVKTEPTVANLQEHLDISNMVNMKLTTPLSVKSESVCGVNQETLQMSEDKFEKSEFDTSNTMFTLSMQVVPVPGITNLPCSTVLGLSSSLETSNDTQIPTNVAPSTGEDAREASGAFASCSVSESVSTVGRKSEVADNMSNVMSRVGCNVVGPESSRTKSTDKLQSDGNSDMAGSDEEKINIFDDMQDECSSSSDDDLDNNHGTSVVMDFEDKPQGCEDDDYEDGEVREPIVHGAIHVGENSDKGTVHDGILANREVGLSGCAADVTVTKPGIMKSSNGNGAPGDLQLSNEHDNCISRSTSLQETSSGEGQIVGTGSSEPIDPFHRGLLNCNGKEDGLKGCEDLSSDGTVSASQGIAPGDHMGCTVIQHENVKGIIPEETKFSVWSKTETLVTGAETTKDVNTKGNQSRIINLAQAFSGPSQGRKISFPGRVFPSRVVRERNSDTVRNGDKLHLRGSRDDGILDGRNKFERHRNQDLSMGNAGSEVMHERGRPDKRFDSTHGEWDSHYNFAPTYSNCLTTYQISGPKNAAAVIVSAGRKPVSDELPNFRHPPSRRRSPGGRGRPVSHVQIVRRSARDISPDRCVGRGDPNLMRLRPDKKFMRGLQEDMMDTVFPRSQPQFQHVDDHFVRGERSFSPIQRKGPLHIPRIRSRSPSRTRSPGPWSSPRRKSPDGFGRSEMIQRRSPPFYRVKRIRSPHQRPIFSDEVEGRRHGSPPYISRISNDLREMGASRESDHPRPFIPNRSPGRVLPRGTARRFDMMERERIENDEYFAGPMHSNRFHEIGSNEGSDGRRICAERRRSFRAAYDPGEVENFQFHVEGGRPYRFSPDSDAEYHERGNFRDRDFERRVKNRTGNTPRRTRSVEEHEESYRHGEQGWHGSGFDDSPGKRRRF